ncbi:MAG: molybdopterin molybdotransferase MoeA [Bacteriovoracaceae bacterium]|nr:molybdopterin molybdotransferase MoeA [Bacteriovoracaceae bacterium]
MISVDQAQKHILDNIIEVVSKKVPLTDALNKVLDVDIYASRDQPPFNRCAMDGIAINLSTFNTPPKSFIIEGIGPAGVAANSLVDPKNCLEVMTGAVLPVNCDCVIRYEDLDIKDNIATIKENTPPLKSMQNVHQMGSDFKSGELLLKKGCLIRSPEVAILAATGHSEVATKACPKVAVVSTGDEVVPIEANPLPYQIRNSNSWAIKSELESFGISEVDFFHLADDEAQTYENLEKILTNYQVVILSGGVSMGKFDLIPDALTNLGIKKVFYKVSQRPGMPLWFGAIKGRSMVFALPGNPVAAITCLRRFVLLGLFKSLSANALNAVLPVYVRLAEDFEYKKDFTYYLPVSLMRNANDAPVANAVKLNGSGDFYSLHKCNGFIEFPKHRSSFLKGEIYPFYRFGRL